VVIPFNEDSGAFEDAELQNLVDKYEVKSYSYQFFQTAQNAYWTVFVEYVGKNPASSAKKAMLSPDQEIYYEALRQWRNELAEAEGMPPYVIASNKQLQQMAGLESFTLEAVRSVKGFGEAKVGKYGQDILRILQEAKAKHEAY